MPTYKSCTASAGSTWTCTTTAVVGLHEGCDGQGRLRCNTCREDVDTDTRFWQRTLRDCLIFGLHDQIMQKKVVLKEKLGNLTLARTRNICRSHGCSTQTQNKIQSKGVREVKKKGDSGKGGGGGKEPPSGGKTITDCGNCKATHPAGSCPAKGIKCRRCGKMGHFAGCCRA